MPTSLKLHPLSVSTYTFFLSLFSRELETGTIDTMNDTTKRTLGAVFGSWITFQSEGNGNHIAVGERVVIICGDIMMVSSSKTCNGISSGCYT